MFSMYLENVVKGMGKTTGGMIVLFAVYPLFLLCDSYFGPKPKNEKTNTKSNFSPFESITTTPPSTPNQPFSKIDENELELKIKTSLDKLVQ